MVKKIYKYQLEAVPRQTITLPVLAQPLKVGMQVVKEPAGPDMAWEIPSIVLVALVNPGAEVAKQEITIRMIMTGEEIADADRLEYLGSVTLHPTGWLNPNGIVAHFFIEKDR